MIKVSVNKRAIEKNVRYQLTTTSQTLDFFVYEQENRLFPAFDSVKRLIEETEKNCNTKL